MKKILIVLMILFLAANCFALELVREKNVATVIVFPLIDSTTTTALQSGATAPDSEIDQWSDSGDNPDGFADCTNEAVEIGTDGQYYLVLTQAEMNDDYIMVQIKATDALTQVILIRTIIGDPSLLATTTAGGLAATEAKQDIIDTNVDDIESDTNELQTDDYPTSIAAIKSETALIVADTGELQTDDYPTSIAAIKAETVLILADTGELQTNQGAWATATSVDLEDNAITAAKINDAAWQELIELFFSWDVTTGTYATATAGSLVKEMVDNATATVPPRIE